MRDICNNKFLTGACEYVACTKRFGAEAAPEIMDMKHQKNDGCVVKFALYHQGLIPMDQGRIIFLNLYLVPKAHIDPAAQYYLDKAYNATISRAYQIEDKDRRLNFLADVKGNWETQTLIQQEQP